MKKIVLVLVVIGLMLVGCGNVEETSNPKDVVEINDWTWEKDAEKDTVHFYGSVTNIMDAGRVYSMAIYVDVLDAGKISIYQDEYELEGKVLNPGESTTFGFEIPCDKDRADNAGLGIRYSWE